MTLRRLRIAQVADKVALPKSTIYNKVKAGDFPKPYKDGASAFWFEHEIDDWLIKLHDLDVEKLKDEA